MEQAAPDLLPLLPRVKGITVEIMNPSGTVGTMRPNHLQAPFDNPGIRRALLHVLDQPAMMQAVVGGDPASYTAPVGVFMPGGPMASDAGLEAVGREKDDLPAVAKALGDAGYKGEAVELIVPTDYLHMRLMGEVWPTRCAAPAWR